LKYDSFFILEYLSEFGTSLFTFGTRTEASDFAASVC
jgi:hypothetical protein